MIDRDGSIAGIYRKLHLFGDERHVFIPGDRGLPIVELAGARIGVLVCYDLRFPEVARILALRGAELLAVPTAWVAGFDPNLGDGPRIPHVDGALVQANLNQVFIACTDMIGRDGHTSFLGRSFVADPYGVPVVGPLSATDPEDVIATIDVRDAHAAADRGPGISPRRDRRTDVYGDLLGYRPPRLD
jgi:predicted amidohydrolase